MRSNFNTSQVTITYALLLVWGKLKKAFLSICTFVRTVGV